MEMRARCGNSAFTQLSGIGGSKLIVFSRFSGNRVVMIDHYGAVGIPVGGNSDFEYCVVREPKTSSAVSR